jgi:NADPH2 dehydrogenase
VSARTYPQIKNIKSVAELRERLEVLGVGDELVLDDDVLSGPDAPLAQAFTVGGRTIGNRFTILPMEGWDGTTNGEPTALVERRWRRFGASGAKLIWGGEAVAVRADGRANPHQLCLTDATVTALADLRLALLAEHERATGRLDDLVVGLQLTHSGRYARPVDVPAPRTARRDPLLDSRLGIVDGASLLDDDDLDALVEDFVDAAERAAAAGFDFVDVKACHGYLGHELLSGFDRGGRYGGRTLPDRARFHLAVIDGIRRRVPDLMIGVRVSVFDLVPYRAGPHGTGVPDGLDGGAVTPRFGMAADGLGPDLDEAGALVDLLHDAGVAMFCVTAGSPYYNPHIQRPAYFPPSDGYSPPEDPLVGVARLLAAAATIKEHRPDTVVVGSGYSYLQDWLAHAAQAQVRLGHVDSVGLGRLVLSYPDLPLDVLAGSGLDRRRVCRTFSDCTTAPRHGLVSGCYPLDEHYKARPERVELAAVKRRIRQAKTSDGEMEES